MTDDADIPRGHEAHFFDMADRIIRNAADTFGGAFVIVSPDGSAIESLVLDPKQNTAHFFMILSTKIQQALNDIEQREQRSHFGGR